MKKLIKPIIVLLIIALLVVGICWVINGGWATLWAMLNNMKEVDGLYYRPKDGGYVCEGAAEKLTDPNLVIPETVNGKPVVGISGTAFIEENAVVNVTLPNTIKYFTFTDCDNIKTINSTEEGTAIMPIDLESGRGGLKNMTKIICPGPNPFPIEIGECTKLVHLEVECLWESHVSTSLSPLSSKFAKAKDGYDSSRFYKAKTWEYDNTPLMQKWEYTEHLVPLSFKSIKVRSGALPEGAFAYLRLTNIELGEDVSAMGRGAFYNCTAIETISVNCPISTIAFEGCTKLKTVNFGTKATSIGAKAFKGCTSLVNLTLSDTTTSIGSSAFENCSNLERINMSDNVATIADAAFKNCEKLMLINDFCILPSKLTAIGKEAFYNTNLASVTIPERCETIGAFAFKSCDSLQVVNSYAETYENNCFQDCEMLNEVNFNGRITYMGANAFRNCRALRKIYIPLSLDIIKATLATDSPFFDCDPSLKIYVEAWESNTDGFSGWWNNYGIAPEQKLTTTYDYYEGDYEALP